MGQLDMVLAVNLHYPIVHRLDQTENLLVLLQTDERVA